MSRLTSSLFHKPLPLDASLLIPSPPESHSDTITAFQPNPSNSQDIGLINHGFSNGSPESAGTRFRKPSSIPYNSSSLRDVKEKGQRKTLIIVIPPPTLVYDHGHFAHTLSNGPFHRLTEGMAMPLFPSMITQLAAIAREFNFPSTSGLCLYFHYVEDGLTLKPRISDDSWPSIWSYLSDPSGQNERRPLISGKVEFDIDLRLARWYASWLSSIHRELADYHAHTFPSAGPSLSHFRGESQATLPEGRPFDVDVAEHLFTQPTEHKRRHVPRTLSLAERFDLVPVRLDVKPISRSALSPPDFPSAGSQVLSTIVQQEEPKSSKDTLDRVKSWRESALLIPNPFATTGQTSLDPANLPNDMEINNELLPASAELKMEDFTWSISSAGPKSCDSLSLDSDARVPSVHLASRIVGSVCSTPSACTSFGADSYECISPMSCDHAPSVHIASRLAGSVCTSPSICTSFGPDDSPPFSPLLDIIYRVPTPDLAYRLYESVPSTPQTATTWGAPLSYPSSPRCLSPSPSLDLGERSMPGESEMSLSSICHDPSSTAVWPYVWPYINEYTKNRLLVAASCDIETIKSTFNYPYLNIYNPIYPYLEIYPAVMTISSQNIPVPSSTPTSDAFVDVKIPSVYPSFDLYPAVYPFNLQRIYPLISANISQDAPDSTPDSPLEIKVEIPCIYPSFCLYPAVYPFNLKRIYPSIPAIISQYAPDLIPDSPPEIKVELPCVYPSFYLYPAVYPFNLEEIYPTIVTQSVSMEFSEGYPYFNIYPDLPALGCPTVKGVVLEPDMSQSIHSRKYPIFDIYPAIYPFFNLYPAVEEHKQAHAPACGINYESSTVESVNTHLEIYDATAYQVVREQDQMADHRDKWSLSTSIETKYPSFNLYKAVYPHFDIYPIYYAGGWSQEDLEQGKKSNNKLKHILAAEPTSSQDLGQQSRLSDCTYPFFNLYPAIYPHFDLYPAPGGVILLQASIPKLRLSTTLELPYPTFNLYPAVYPYFDLYLPLPELEIQSPLTLKKDQVKSSSRLTHSELHAMVMMEGLKEFGDSHFMESSSFSKIRQNPPMSRPLRDRFGGGTRGFLQNAERQTEILPQRKVENIRESDSSGSPRRRDSVVWQRIKAFDLSNAAST